MNQIFRGVWPAMLTPLEINGEPALDQVDQLVELFVEQGLDGLYILGSTGQGPLLAVTQRKTVAERVVKSATGRIPVMVHVGAAATDDAIELARHAAEIGADAVSSVAPYYYPVTADAVFEHYRQIGAATQLPFFVYHLSATNTLSLQAGEYVDRLLSLPNIAGMKYTDLDLCQLGLIHAHAGDRLQLFSGADQLVSHAVLSGATGAIGTFYNLWGKECQTAREALLSGQVETAQEFMLVFQSVINELKNSQSMWTFLQAAMKERYGIDVGPPRSPLAIAEKTWNDSDVKRLLEKMENISQIVAEKQSSLA